MKYLATRAFLLLSFAALVECFLDGPFNRLPWLGIATVMALWAIAAKPSV